MCEQSPKINYLFETAEILTLSVRERCQMAFEKPVRQLWTVILSLASFPLNRGLILIFKF